MAQPKSTPTAVRFRPEVDAGITAYVEKTGMSRNSAINDLVAQGLLADSGGGPAFQKIKAGLESAIEMSRGGAPAARAAVEAKGLPIGAGSELPGAPETANEAAARINAARDASDRARRGWFSPKGRKS